MNLETNQDTKFVAVPTDVSPQPLLYKNRFEDIRAGVNNNINDVINLLVI